MQKISYSALCLIAILLSACGGGTTSRSISGSIFGPTSAVVLQNNGGDNLTVSAAGTFSFGTPVADGNTYDITVLTQPAGQTCAVSKGKGIVSGDDITDVAVTCTRKAYSVGGTISGLTGNLVLQNNSADNLALTADGIFNFATHLKDDNPYNVTVLTQPAGQHCGVVNGTGTIAEASVSNIAVTCVTNGDSVSFYKPVGSLQCVGGGMSIPQMEHPLAATGIPVISSGCGSDGMMYPAVCGYADGSIGIFEVPADQAQAALKLGFAMLSDLPDATKFACPIKVEIPEESILLLLARSGSKLIDELQASDVRSLEQAANVAISGVRPILGDIMYAIDLKSPVTMSEAWSIANRLIRNHQDVASAWANERYPIPNVIAYSVYSVGGMISGLTGNVVLQNNNSDSLTVATDGTFNFAAWVIDGSAYNVTVLTQPAGQHCSVASGTGTIAADSVTNVAVTCATNTSNEIVYETLHHSSHYSGIPFTGEPVNLVIRNISDWAAVWSAHVSTLTPTPPPPTVDFNSRMVIGIVRHAGSGCYDAEIKKIFNLNGELVVEYVPSAPAPGAICTQSMTAPAHFVTVPQSQLPVRFVGIAN